MKAPKTTSSDFVLGGFPLIEFGRKPIDRHLLTGFALGWNDDLTLIHAVNRDVFRLNGYAIFRNSDVKRWRPVAEDDFVARAARLHRLRPSRPPKVGFGSMREALESAGQEFPLITIHRERTDRRACYIGKFLRTSQRVLTIRYISPQAEWEGEDKYSLKDITLLEFGGEYETLLYRLAGLPPESRK